MPNIEALKQLRRVVEAAPEDRFDMSVFEDLNPRGCGTVRCALGNAAYDPWFQKNKDINSVLMLTDDLPLVQSGSVFEWAHLTFGLSHADTDRLFSGYPETTREEVIANIDRLISGLPALDYERDDDDYNDYNDYNEDEDEEL